jgi:hypothetical protein
VFQNELNELIIRKLRQRGPIYAGGAAVMTPGIAALGAAAVARIVKTVGGVR